MTREGFIRVVPPFPLRVRSGLRETIELSAPANPFRQHRPGLLSYGELMYQFSKKGDGEQTMRIQPRFFRPTSGVAGASTLDRITSFNRQTHNDRGNGDEADPTGQGVWIVKTHNQPTFYGNRRAGPGKLAPLVCPEKNDCRLYEDPVLVINNKTDFIFPIQHKGLHGVPQEISVLEAVVNCSWTRLPW